MVTADLALGFWVWHSPACAHRLRSYGHDVVCPRDGAKRAVALTVAHTDTSRFPQQPTKSLSPASLAGLPTVPLSSALRPTTFSALLRFVILAKGVALCWQFAHPLPHNPCGLSSHVGPAQFRYYRDENSSHRCISSLQTLRLLSMHAIVHPRYAANF